MFAVVDVGGVGYRLQIPLSTSEALSAGEEACLYTHLVVREDDLRLYGFASRDERDVFVLLLSVPGGGPATALEALSIFSSSELLIALSTGDLAVIRQIKGVGKKLAERMVLELKERAALLGPRLASGAAAATAGRAAGGESVHAVSEAVKALIEIGYPRRSAEERVAAVYRKVRSDDGPAPTVEDLIRGASRGS